MSYIYRTILNCIIWEKTRVNSSTAGRISYPSLSLSLSYSVSYTVLLWVIRSCLLINFYSAFNSLAFFTNERRIRDGRSSNFYRIIYDYSHCFVFEFLFFSLVLTCKLLECRIANLLPFKFSINI